MEIELSGRSQAVKPSPTFKIASKARQLKASGGDIISLSVGEPDFDTPDHIKKAAIEAIENGYTKYTAIDGNEELKESIINKFKRDNKLIYVPQQICVSAGAKQSLYNLFQALLNPGDEVIIPTPYWPSYPDMALLAEAVPVFIQTGFSQNYKLTPEQLEQSITDKTRLFVINAPSNPTGVMYSKNELTELGEVLLKYPEVYIATDDIYEHILWGQRPFHNILMACPELYDRTIVINGVSKAYSMTGWRIGYAAGHKDIISGMRKIQSQSTSNPCSISQVAAQAALDGDQQCVQDMVKAFKARHDFVVQALKNIDGISCNQCQGTFYCFPDISNIIKSMNGIENDIEFSEHLLTKSGVAVIPGSAFGAEGCIRLSYATELDVLNDAMKRIKTVINS